MPSNDHNTANHDPGPRPSQQAGDRHHGPAV